VDAASPAKKMKLSSARRSAFLSAALAVLVALSPIALAAQPATPPSPPSRQPPKFFQAVYLTTWSAGSRHRIARVIDLAHSGRINAVVLDIKDATGDVAYDAAVPDVRRYGARHVNIRNIDALIEQLHREGLYVIARIVVFQDPRLALARPDLAVHQKSKLTAPKAPLTAATLWLDRKHLAWLDPAAKDAWAYNVAIAEDALRRGFDEINFDYVQFPSDGSLEDMAFPVWDGVTLKHEVIVRFFADLRRQMPHATLSVDLFGLSTVQHDDLGVGQIIEDAYQYFNYVCPMVYPSHYAVGFLNYENPAEHPYEVVNYSMAHARARLLAASGGRAPETRLRPWLQDFNLGAVYTPEMVEAQVKAARDALGSGYCGYILWSPSNIYTDAVLPKLSATGAGPHRPAEPRLDPRLYSIPTKRAGLRRAIRSISW
jgi:hypothetical protein